MFKKLMKYIAALILSLIFVSCDENFGSKLIYNMYLFVECSDDVEMSLEYKIPNIEIEDFVVAKEVELTTSENKMIDALNLDSEKNYRTFYMKNTSDGSVQDKFNFEFDFNLKYAGDLYDKILIIPKLESGDLPPLGSKAVFFDFEDGDTKIPAILIYKYAQTI